MNEFKKYLAILLTVLLVFAGNGCLEKPTLTASDFGAVSILFSVTGSSSLNQKALAGDIQSIKISLVHKNKKISKEEQIPFTGNSQQVNFDSLYPGEWQISAAAIDLENDSIFQGSVNTLIEPGDVNQVQLPLLASPGTLDISLDASKIPGFGTEFTKGTLYIYFDPETSDSKSYTLTMDGTLLKTAISIPEGSCQIKVAAPNVSTAVYTSPYYTINIKAGKNTSFAINPNCALAVNGQINSTPATPANLQATYQMQSSSVSLSWSPVTDSDLAGYRLYRTDNEGRFIRTMTFPSEVASYTDTVKTDILYQGTVGYAISSYDLGGYESLWSEAVVVKP